MKKHFLILALLAAHTSASWAIFDDNEARKAILELRNESRARDEVQNRRLADLETQAAQLKDQVAQVEVMKRNLLDLLNQLNAAKEENAKLKGELEQLRNDLAAQQRRTRDLALDIDERIKKLEPRTVTVDNKAVTVDRQEELSYNAALKAFRDGDYKAASQAFSSFVAQYPQSGLASSAAFWLGTSQFANRDSKAAAVTLQALLDKEPNHPRAADALLTLGNAHTDLKDNRSAQAAYNKVIKDFPNSQAAELAKEKLPRKRP